MQWRIWAVAGEALNFGGRRMETIMRVAWLPVILLLFVQMVTIFLGLSIAVERPITFTDTFSYLGAQQYYPEFAVAGWQRHPLQMSLLTGTSVLISLMLIASFIVPLIRYAATGEKPPAGLIRMPFGPDQLRFCFTAIVSGFLSILVLFAPLMAAFSAVYQYLFREVVTTTIDNHVKFPFEQSIHSVYETNIADLIIASENWWVWGIPISFLLLSGPLAGLLVGLLLRHFHPKNRPFAPEGRRRPLLRVLGITGITLVVTALLWALLTGTLPRPSSLIDPLPVSNIPVWGAMIVILNAAILSINSIMTALFGLIPTLGDPFKQFALFAILLGLILFYINFRLFAWPGSAVMDKSMSLRQSLLASRGWNLFRIIFLVALVFVITFAMQFVINFLLAQVIFPTILYLFGLLITTTRLVNSGVSADWVPMVVVWTWNIIRILINVFWLFFSYGALAGLYGRLYAHVKAARPYLPQ